MNNDQWHASPELWEKLALLPREKRTAPTAAEARVWTQLRDKKLGGFRFRRQHAIGQFIVDFYCAESRVVVEIDALGQHSDDEQTRVRREFFEINELSVIHFTDSSVKSDLHSVLAQILKASPQF